MFHILWSIILGFIVGFIAKHLMGEQFHFIATVVLGIVGSVVGGLIARLFSKPKDGAFIHPAGLLLSIIGAMVALFVWNRIG